MSTDLREDAFVRACAGDDEPRIWRLSWAEDLVEDLWRRRDPGEDEDPDAMMQAYGHTKRMFEMLRAALDQADGKEE